jgi:hypothetical protein
MVLKFDGNPSDDGLTPAALATHGAAALAAAVPALAHPGALALKFTGELIKIALPSGMSRAVAWATGKEILVVGAAQSGKSSFGDYVRFGVLERPGQTDRTDRETATRTFSVEAGRNMSLKMSVSTLREYPGHEPPEFHARIAAKRRPHALFVMVDSTSPTWDSWLEVFFRELNGEVARNQKVLKRLRHLAVVINKMDKVGVAVIESQKKRIDELALTTLHNLGARARGISVAPCASVAGTAYGTAPIDNVLLTAMRRLVVR